MVKSQVIERNKLTVRIFRRGYFTAGKLGSEHMSSVKCFVPTVLTCAVLPLIPRIKIRRYKTYRSYGTVTALKIVITNRLIVYTKMLSQMKSQSRRLNPFCKDGL